MMLDKLGMNVLDRFSETIASYTNHNWTLRRVLMCVESRRIFSESDGSILAGIEPGDFPVDALWFSRPSHAGREAWELRLVGDAPYALFEAFDAGVSAEEREEVLKEMESRLSEYATRT